MVASNGVGVADGISVTTTGGSTAVGVGAAAVSDGDVASDVSAVGVGDGKGGEHATRIATKSPEVTSNRCFMGNRLAQNDE